MSAGVTVIGVIRDGRRVFARPGTVKFQSGDIVLLETDTPPCSIWSSWKGWPCWRRGRAGASCG